MHRVLCIGLILSACGRVSLDDVTFPIGAATRASFDASTKYSLTFEHAFGSSVGAGSIRRTSLAAAINGDTLAVADLGTCSVVLFSIATSGFLRRLGACDKGLTEDRSVTALSFDGPNLLAFDRSRTGEASIYEIAESTSTRTLTTVAMASTDVGRRGVTFLSVHDNQYMLNASYLTRSRDSPHYVLVGDAATGRVTDRYVPVPPAALTTVRSLYNAIGLCKAALGSETVYVAANQWHPEIVVWRGELSARAIRTYRAADPFGKPRFYLRKGERLPRFKRVRASCGDQAAVLSFEEVLGREDKATIKFTYVIAEYSGTAYVLPDDHRGRRRGHVIAAKGELFFFADASGDSGVVTAYRLTANP